MAEISLLKSPKSPIINFVLEKSFRDAFLEKWSVRDERWILYTVIFSVKEIILDRNKGEKEKVNTTLTNKQTNKQLCRHIKNPPQEPLVEHLGGQGIIMCFHQVQHVYKGYFYSHVLIFTLLLNNLNPLYRP